jgi:hypothetical protein
MKDRARPGTGSVRGIETLIQTPKVCPNIGF